MPVVDAAASTAVGVRRLAGWLEERDGEDRVGGRVE